MFGRRNLRAELDALAERVRDLENPQTLTEAAAAIAPVAIAWDYRFGIQLERMRELDERVQTMGAELERLRARQGRIG